MSSLHFNAEHHRYTFYKQEVLNGVDIEHGGQALPSVRTVLKATGLSPSKFWGGEGAAVKGTYAHEATELHDRG